MPQEIDLNGIRFEISEGRSKIYCIQSLKNALWKYLVPRGLVEVVKQFTKRVMRVIANHAGPIKEIEKRFGKLESNLQSTKQICFSEPENLEVPSYIQRTSDNTTALSFAVEKDGGEDCDDEELSSIQDAIADAPFMRDDNEQQPSPPIEPPREKEFSAVAQNLVKTDSLPQRLFMMHSRTPNTRLSVSTRKSPTAVTRCQLARLRSLGVPLTSDVRALIAQTPEPRLERNISALEEEAATKGLKSPIAALKYFVAHNCQPRLWDRQAWWNRAAVALGRERRDQLIQAVFEYLGEVVVMFTNGQQLPLAQAQGMSWEAIAALGVTTFPECASIVKQHSISVRPNSNPMTMDAHSGFSVGDEP